MKIQKSRRRIVPFLGGFIIFSAAQAADTGAPAAEQRPVTDVAATNSGKPIFLSINAHAGHGIGSALSIRNQQADVYAFLFDQLGMQLPQK
jgi:hypothetical protein